VSFKNTLALSASAGSGKTFALSVRYLSLLFMGEEPSTILAATFTNKAAAEMKERVIKLLIHLEEKEPELNAIAHQTGFSKKELLEKQPEVLERFLSSSNFIVTLDSFFTSILRSSSLYIDLEPDFVTKEIDPKVKEENFLDEVQSNSLLHGLVKLALNIEDRRFVKIFELMQSFYKIDPILPKKEYALGSSSKIEMQIEQVRTELHRLVVESGASKTAIKNFEPIEIKELFKKSVFNKRTLLEHRNYKKYVEKNPKIDELFLELKELLSQWAEIKEQVVLHNLFAIYDYYKNANIYTARQLGVLSFDDLAYFTYRLLYASENRDFIYFKIDSRFRHILLDEFQDTSTLQFLLLKPLIEEVVSGIGTADFRSFFYVGDTKQSLYRFRGGVEELFGYVANRYGIEVENMDTNYRSARVVVEQVNRWFEPNMQGYLPQKANGLKDKSGEEIEGYVAVVTSDNIEEEVIAQLKYLLSRGVALEEIAILVSTNKDGARLQEACFAQGYATSLKTSSSLKHTPKVAAVVAMVAYLYGGVELDAKAMLQSVDKKLEDFDFSWFSAFMEPLDVVHRLLVEFGYFEEDMNLLKLLEFASEFLDIPTFLEEFHLSQIDVASRAKNGVSIMTIHGSKGLEFQHVIVADRLKGAAPERSALLYEYDEELYVQRVLYKMRGREHFDEEYATLVEKQKQLSKKDKMNVLYVALTRAVESMIVIKKEKDSIFDALGMTPIAVGELRLQPKKKNLYSNASLESLTISHYGLQEVTKEEDEENRDYDAILFGTALHYTLEMLPSFSLMGLAQAMMATQNRYGLELSSEQLEQIKKRVLELITHSRFQKLLEGATVSLEQSLAYEGELKQIDLLLEYEKRCLVIDYKSSKSHQQKHFAQVRHYKQAIESIKNQPTEGMLVYLLEDKIEFVKV